MTALRLSGVELLYLDDATLADPSRSVRGGIPILFPNAEAARPEGSRAYPLLPKHGLARLSARWERLPADARTFRERLVSDEESLARFPHAFELEVRASLEAGGCRIEERVRNTGAAPLPIAMGLHPYFRVPQEEKRNIVFENFARVDSARDARGREVPGARGKRVEECADIWSAGGAVSLANEGVPLRLALPRVGTIELAASLEYRRLWVWSEPEKDFVCVEPFMRERGGLAQDPELVAPGNICAAGLALRVV